MTCPKCQSPMTSYERNGVTVDQCTGCRGLFLDRGELERLVDAEGAYYERAAQPIEREVEPRREGNPQQHRDRDDWRPGYGHSHGQGQGHGKRKKKSFLDDFLDFG